MRRVLLLSFLCASSFSFADGINVANKYLQTGTIDQNELTQEYRNDEVKYPDQIEILKQRIKNSANIPSNVKFMKMVENPNYSPDASMLLNSKAVKAPDICLNGAYQPPSNYRLPMNTSPLNQGNFGTCVTFSMLGMMQASIQNNNISTLPSQSCTLNMIVSTTGKNIWNGAVLDDVWGPMINNGYIPNNKVPNNLICNNSFPYYEAYGSAAQSGQGLTTSLSSYNANSIKQSLPIFPVISNYMQKPVYYLRSALACPKYTNVQGAPGNYIQFTFMFINSTMNATISDETGTRTYTTFYADYGPPTPAGHAVYAYAYNDNICIQTPRGQQCGVIYLRNSWGNSSDNGNYLMTYEYYNLYAKNHSPQFYALPNMNYK